MMTKPRYRRKKGHKKAHREGYLFDSPKEKEKLGSRYQTGKRVF